MGIPSSRKNHLILSLVFLAAGGLLSAGESGGEAVQAEIRLSGEEAQALRGPWLFYPGEIIPPEKFSREGELPAGGEAVTVPHYWSWDPPRGAGTYYTRVTVPEEMGWVGWKSAIVSSSYTLFVDGDAILQGGQPGLNRESSRMGWKVSLGLTPPPGDSGYNVVVHVANWRDAVGGFTAAFKAGSALQTARERQNLLVFDLFLFGALLMMAFYHGALFFHRRQEAGFLYFSGLLFFLAFRVILYGELFFLELFPQTPWPLLVRLGFWTLSVSVGLIVLFLFRLFPETIPPKAAHLAAVPAWAYTLAVLVLPVEVFAAFLLPFQIYTLAVAGLLIFILARAFRQGGQGAAVFLIGFLVFLATIVNDILISQGVYAGVFLVPLGMLVFLLFQSFVLTRKFAGALELSERYSDYLQRVNEALQRFIPREFLGFLRRRSLMEVEFGDHTDVTMAVLILDIRDFTSLSEQMTPEDNFRFINSFLKYMGPLVRKQGGFIDKYLGDGFMALFPQGSAAAAEAALDMREALTGYNQGRIRAGYEPVFFGIGIHEGRLLLGTVGENRRMDGSVLSEAVDRAFEVEVLTKEYQRDILLSRQAAAGLDEELFHTEPVDGVFFLRGKS